LQLHHCQQSPEKNGEWVGKDKGGYEFYMIRNVKLDLQTVYDNHNKKIGHYTLTFDYTDSFHNTGMQKIGGEMKIYLLNSAGQRVYADPTIDLDLGRWNSHCTRAPNNPEKTSVEGYTTAEVDLDGKDIHSFEVVLPAARIVGNNDHACSREGYFAHDPPQPPLAAPATRATR
jgi:hypothetical protein